MADKKFKLTGRVFYMRKRNCRGLGLREHIREHGFKKDYYVPGIKLCVLISESYTELYKDSLYIPITDLEGNLIQIFELPHYMVGLI